MKNITPELVDEVVNALTNIRGWGSVEIHVQDHKVVQITERNITKTSTAMTASHTVKIGS